MVNRVFRIALLFAPLFSASIALAAPFENDGGNSWVEAQLRSNTVPFANASFSSGSELLQRGPAWFWNALSAPAPSRSYSFVLDRAGDPVEPAYVGTLRDTFTVQTFSDVATFSGPRGGTFSSSVAPSAPTVAGTENDFFQNASMNTAGNYSLGHLPTNTEDVLLTTSSTALTITAANRTMASLNQTNNTAYTISNATTGATSSNLTLGGGGTTNSIAGSNAADLIYLGGATSSLTIQGPNSSSGSGTLNVVLAASGNFDVAQSGASLTISSTISGNTFGITKTGAGRLTLSGANTYTGGTSVNGGTLLASNTTGSATGTGAVTVNNTGTLGGAGFINAGSNNITINSGGNITGGTDGSVGTLTLTANTLTISGTYLTDVNGATADRITLTGNLTLSPGSTIDFNTISAPSSGSYTLLSYSGSLSGTFSNVIDLPSNYTIQYNAGEIDLVAVPEPSTWIGAALALAAIGFTQRRKLRGFIGARA